MAIVTRRYRMTGANLVLIQKGGDPGSSLPALGYTANVDVTFDDAISEAAVVDTLMQAQGYVFVTAAPSGVPSLTVDTQLSLLAQAAAPVGVADRLHLSSLSIATRRMLATTDPDSISTLMQPLLARNKVGVWLPQGSSTLPAGIGMTAPLSTGNLTGRNPASTNLATSMRRIGNVSLGVPNSVASFRGQQLFLWRGNAAGLGGFTVIIRFLISDAAIQTGNMFVGLRDVTTVPLDVAPSTVANLVGIGCNVGDTTMQLYAAGAVAQARTDLGANFPVNTADVDVYELALFCAPNAADIRYEVTRLNTGHVAAGTISAAASLPSNTTFMAPRVWRSDGGAGTVAIDLVSAYCETNY